MRYLLYISGDIICLADISLGGLGNWASVPKMVGKLLGYDLTIVYKPEPSNKVAYALSTGGRNELYGYPTWPYGFEPKIQQDSWIKKLIEDVTARSNTSTMWTRAFRSSGEISPT